jgi:prepilin-type processing-associated H-X9-DG protein
MGQLVQIYAAENGGYLPYGKAETAGYNNGGAANFYSTYYTSYVWDWPDTLTRLTNSATPGVNGKPQWVMNLSGEGLGGITGPPVQFESNMASDYSPLFHDYDTSGLPYAARVSDFMCNPRVLADNTMMDAATFRTATPPPMVNGYPSATNVGASQGDRLPIRSLGSIQHSSQVMMIWCGPQNLLDGQTVEFNWPFGAVADNIDESAINWGPPPSSGAYYLCNPSPGTGYPSSTKGGYNTPINLGNCSTPSVNSSRGFVSMALLKEFNNDATNVTDPTQYNGDPANAMRFRHMNNTTGNFLFVDGHVESRALGQVNAIDISVNPTLPSGPPTGN